MLKLCRRAAPALLLALVTSDPVRAEPSAPSVTPSATTPLEATAETPWCAPELQKFPGEVCAYVPESTKAPKILVIYLHGLVKANTEWQWTQERSVVRNAKRMGFAALMPRGRMGIAPKKWPDYWSWPTSASAQAAVEEELISEWRSAQQKLEEQLGAPFQSVYVLGFSNGAYYGSSLALRGRFPVDGYGIFAGGGHSSLKTPGEANRNRTPIYVGFGLKDREATRDSSELATLLRALHWPHHAMGRRGVGHAMTDSQVEAAFQFFRKQHAH